MNYALHRKKMIEESTRKYHMELDKIRELEGTQEVYLTAACECRNWLWQPIVRILYTINESPTEYIVEIIKETGKVERV